MASSTGHEGPPVRRFVVLRHDISGTTHFDLMIDGGSLLATWQCPSPPEDAQQRPLLCRRIGDHRRMYLDYEGPVSGDRGHVTRHDVGTCRIARWGDDGVEVTFEGRQLVGRYALELRDGQSWSLRCLST
jgi:hypothetical protein